MPATATKQLRFDLHMPEHRPLLPMKALMWLLERSEDDVMALIECGSLEFAFDLRRQGTAKALPVVWRGSVYSYAGQSDVKSESVDHVVDDVLPPVMSIRAVELKSIFGCCGQLHICRLIEDDSLALDTTRSVGRGKGQSPWVTRASAAAFLKARRMA
jgi:hypothetical protein